MSKDKSGNWFKRHKVLTVIGVLILLAIIGGASSGSKNTGSTTSTSKSSASNKPAATTAMAKLNQPANDGKFQFTVTSIKCGQPSVSSTDGYITKTAQGQYCLVNITANNIGDQSQTLDSTSQYLYDSSNKKYSSDDEATIDISPTDNTFFNAINPGNTVSGTVVFDLPKGVTPTIAELHDSGLSGGVKVSLQ
jgi:hypothetical protein